MEDFLRCILPESHPYKLVEITGDKIDDFTTKFRLQCASEEEFDEWKSAFEMSSASQWNSRTSNPNGRAKFSKGFDCHHSGFNKKAGRPVDLRNKNTNCPAALKVTVRNYYVRLWCIVCLLNMLLLSFRLRRTRLTSERKDIVFTWTCSYITWYLCTANQN
jgi:hypothetical protein